MFQHHAILVSLSINSGNQSLTKRVVQGVIDVRHADPQTAGAVAINIDIRHQPFVLPVAGDIRKLWQLLEFFHELRHPGAERIQRCGLQGKLVLGAADLSINSQVLRWLQEEIDARHFIHRRLQTGDDFLHPVISFIQWFEIDL